MANRFTWSIKDRVRLASQVLTRAQDEELVPDTICARKLRTTVQRLRSICRLLAFKDLIVGSHRQGWRRNPAVPDPDLRILCTPVKTVINRSAEPVDLPPLTKRKCRGCKEYLRADRFFQCRVCQPTLPSVDDDWIYANPLSKEDDSHDYDFCEETFA